jgi:hypothetical protein
LAIGDGFPMLRTYLLAQLGKFFFFSDFFDWSFFPLWLTMYWLVCCCPLHARFPPSRRGLAQLVVYYNTFPILYISWISSHAIVS